MNNRIDVQQLSTTPIFKAELDGFSEHREAIIEYTASLQKTHSARQAIFLKPKSGMLVLFPSYLMHMVAPHNADTDRISIAINYKMS